MCVHAPNQNLLFLVYDLPNMDIFHIHNNIHDHDIKRRLNCNFKILGQSSQLCGFRWGGWEGGRGACETQVIHQLVNE